MSNHTDSPNIRKGQFIWMEKSSQESYVKSIRAKIALGYFSSDTILTKIVDELAEVMAESAGYE